MKFDAVISDCGTYRYSLTRVWDKGRGLLVFCMLNPSTADGKENDPTIRKCIGFAMRLGFGGIHVVNLSAFRAKKPSDLRKAKYAPGPDNLQYLREAFAGNTVVLAWGAHGAEVPLLARGARELAKIHADQVCILRDTKYGHPEHPLMLPYSCELILLHTKGESHGS